MKAESEARNPLHPYTQAAHGKVRPGLGDLVRHPREDLHIEVKSWLDLGNEDHKADLAKAIMALANHGGVESLCSRNTGTHLFLTEGFFTRHIKGNVNG